MTPERRRRACSERRRPAGRPGIEEARRSWSSSSAGSRAERTTARRVFAVNSVSRHTLDPAEDGIVIEQRPAGGTSAGAEVTITVGALTP
jgi:hypothetical protein